MNKREEQRLNELLAKKEAEEKADKEFFKQVKKRKDEVLKVLKVDISNDYENRLKKTADKYGCTIVELLDYIETERQVSYYRNTHRKGTVG
jgi:alpha-galactosidase/6-phospho-beta-glucosidase family protein